MPTGIPYCTETLNPVTGCVPVSPGCGRCYAREMTERLQGMGSERYLHGFDEVRCHPEVLLQLARWTKPRRILLPSMSDIFQDAVMDDFIFSIIDACIAAPQHLIYLLTKRVGRMASLTNAYVREREIERMPKNLLWGCTIEGQQYANDRLPKLFMVPAHSPEHYWASIEPLLGPIRLRETYRACPACGKESDVLSNRCPVENAGIPRLGWVAVGCESGANRRDTRPEWIGEVIKDCRAAGTSVYLKQMDINGTIMKTPGWMPDDPCDDLPFPDWGA